MAESFDPNDKEEKVNFLYTAIESLNSIEKAIIMLYLDNLKYREIAEDSWNQ